MEKIFWNNSLLAIILRGNFSCKDIEFFTPEDFEQQLGYMNRSTGHIIGPHFHNNETVREICRVMEFLYLKKGKLRVDLYSDEEDFVESRILEAGDAILLASGGHGFEMLQPSELIEVKQGPYLGDNDKKFLDG